MKRRMLAVLAAGALAATMAVPAAAASGANGREYRTATYEVTITNLSETQPLSPPVVATHRKAVRLFKVGDAASQLVVPIAEDGNQLPAVDALGELRKVTDVVDVGAPLTRSGTTVADFTDSVTFEIEARRGDRLSLAGMLICTNDGFTGLDAAKLPKHGNGTMTYYANAYDAGSEMNTEKSVDIVDPCSALGAVPLDGDPNGNNNAGIDEDRAIRPHPGIVGSGKGELSMAHAFDDPIAKVEVTMIRDLDNTREFEVELTNLAATQPLSPPVVATHNPGHTLAQPGTAASDVIEAIAENGDQSGAVAKLMGKRWVTDVVDVGVPLTPSEKTVGDFTDSVSFAIHAKKGDQLSLAGMLICTNDGLVLADRLPLPRHGTVTYYLFGYDAGTERNTELSADIVDPCSALGPVVLAGDPNGNNNDGIDTDGFIAPHPGVDGTIGDLLDAHNWDEPVAMITISG